MLILNICLCSLNELQVHTHAWFTMYKVLILASDWWFYLAKFQSWCFFLTYMQKCCKIWVFGIYYGHINISSIFKLDWNMLPPKHASQSHLTVQRDQCGQVSSGVPLSHLHQEQQFSSWDLSDLKDSLTLSIMKNKLKHSYMLARTDWLFFYDKEMDGSERWFVLTPLSVKFLASKSFFSQLFLSKT